MPCPFIQPPPLVARELFRYTHRMNERNKALIYLSLATVVWGSTFVILKLLLPRISPLVLVGSRFALAAIVAGVVLKLRGEEINRAMLRRGTVLGLVLMGGYIFQTVGLQYTGAGKSGFITTLYLVFVPMFSWPLSKQRPKWRIFVAIAISLGGVWLLADPEGALNPGDLITALSAVCFGAQLALIDHFMAKEGSVDASSGSVLGITVVQLVVVAVGAFALAPILEVPRFTFDLVSIGGLLYLAVVATVFVWLWQMKWQPVLGAEKASLLYVGEAIVAAAGGVIVFGESLPWYGYLGAGLILLAAVWTTLSDKQKS